MHNFNDFQVVGVLIAVPPNSHWGKIQEKPDHMTTSSGQLLKLKVRLKQLFFMAEGSNWGNLRQNK